MAEKEVSTLIKLKHENIVAVQESWDNKIVMELLPLSLFDLIIETKGFEEAECQHLFK